jgi:hypothetical protein
MPAVITLTAAPSGTGKTYIRCPVFLLHDWLPRHTGNHISNFPIHRDRLAQEASRRTRKPAEQFRNRLHQIPPATIATWKPEGKSGPWEWFDTGEGHDLDLNGAHIALDEAHQYMPSGQRDAKHVTKWATWLGHVRHLGATVELITQHPDKLARRILNEIELKRILTNAEEDRDPIFHIKQYDWYQLDGKIFGHYEPRVWVVEYNKVEGKWNEIHRDKYRLRAEYFDYYDSYNAVQGSRKGDHVLMPWESKSHLGLAWWFIRNNLYQLVSRAFYVIAILALFRYSKHIVKLFFALFAATGLIPGSQPAQAAPKETTNHVHQTPTPHHPAQLHELPHMGTTPTTLEELHQTPTPPLIQEALLALTPNAVALKYGGYVTAQSRVPYGPLEDYFVQRIDHVNKTVRLDNYTTPDTVTLSLPYAGLLTPDQPKRPPTLHQSVRPADRPAAQTHQLPRTRNPL